MELKGPAGRGDSLTQVMEYYKEACKVQRCGNQDRQDVYPCLLGTAKPGSVSIFGALSFDEDRICCVS